MHISAYYVVVGRKGLQCKRNYASSLLLNIDYLYGTTLIHIWPGIFIDVWWTLKPQNLRILISFLK